MDMAETPKQHEALKTSGHKKVRKTSRLVAIATIISGLLAIPATAAAFYPIWKDNVNNKPVTQHIYDGPIAKIATDYLNWDKRGFDPRDMDSLASRITYQYGGHYIDKDGDRNPTNEMCTIVLYANPATALPYGQESGFVYIQAGTATHSTSEILYNPKSPDAVYRLQIKNGQYVPPQCWPGDGHQNNDVRYPHRLEEY